MTKVTISDGYKGRASKPVSWEALLRIFDTIWGSEARSLPKYPRVIGAVHALWHDASGTKYEVNSLDEIGCAYKKYKTAFISFNGKLGEGPSCNFKYWPARSEASIDVRATSQETVELIIDEVRQQFPLTAKYVFISYHTAECKLAIYMKKVLEKRLLPGVSVFVAEHDIEPGESWLKTMLEEQLLRAEALVALCSKRSKKSPWLWWESSAVWARGGLVIPLFIDLSPGEFDGPITLVCQGRCFFEVEDIKRTLCAVINEVCPAHPCEELTQEEISELKRLRHLSFE